MRETVNALADLEVYSIVGGKVGEVVFIKKLLGDVGEFYLIIFGTVKQGD